MVSAVLFGQIIDKYADAPLGKTILAAVDHTQKCTGTNTNLGLVLLIAPLAKAIRGSEDLDRDSIQRVWDELTMHDGELVYTAIRNARPGGLGSIDDRDVRHSHGPQDLMAAMRTAESHDRIARQYTTHFENVLDDGVPLLIEGRSRFASLSQAIVFAHVSLMARFTDSLIQRKCGEETAVHAQMLARKALEAFENDVTQAEDWSELFWSRVGELDFWLRSDGHRRNPGTTADLIAASLFVAIQTGRIEPPFR